MIPEPTKLIGLDLGQQRDFTAVSVVERLYQPIAPLYNEEYFDRVTGRQKMRARQPVSVEYHVRHLQRPDLGTPYTEIVASVLELIKTLGGHLVLVVDATGVGRPVSDLLRQRLAESLKGTSTTVTPCFVTITGGNAVSRNTDRGLNVPKRDLISAALVLMQNGQLKIADALALKDTLVKELLAFRVTINISTAHDSYEHWREGDHDDLVLSVALACWAGERFLRKESSVLMPGQIAADAPITSYKTSS
jgi:hypothetical protein